MNCTTTAHRRARTLSWGGERGLPQPARRSLTPAGASAAPTQRTAVIVQLEPGSDAAVLARQTVGPAGQVSHVYSQALVGFACGRSWADQRTAVRWLAQEQGAGGRAVALRGVGAAVAHQVSQDIHRGSRVGVTLGEAVPVEISW